uniref:Sushi domain-containing protein n=1 Tax=Spermophilus dauricus TaxID=99837 RepID=A0A8C9Q474_SPEDA
CDFPTVVNGRLAQYYYTFKSFYFPMSIDKKLPFFCLADYTTERGKQEEQSRCSAEGWSPEPRRFKTCSAPELHNGNYSTTQKTFKVQDKVRYECAAGYYTAGGKHAEEVECHTYGWSLTPKCTKLQCSSLRLIENGYFHPIKQTNEEGDVVQFFCHENYYLSGSDLIQCYNFGWYPESHVCEGRRHRCPPPPLPLNSKTEKYSTAYRHGEIVRIQCELNFLIQGSEEIRCESGTKWSLLFKWYFSEEKEKTVCEEPPFLENGAANLHSKIYYSGDKVTYRCDRGYHICVSNEIACNHGKWTVPPECVENNENCRPPPNITNEAVVGVLLPSYTTGSSVEYRCNEYYLLRGTKISHCGQGRWSSPPVYLEPCTVNSDNMNRNNIEMKWAYEGKILHGDLIDFVCKQGYDLPPSTLSGLSVQCNRGEVKYPLCVRKESKGICFDHHFLQGPREAYCVEGVWTTPPLCLEPCTLSFVEMERNNLLLKWDFDNRPHIFHGEYIEFLCRRDTYVAEASSVIVSELRVQCDRGQLKYPRCIPRDR